MKLCKYWDVAETSATDADGKILRLRKWGGSNTSAEDAKRAAKRALDDLAGRVASSAFRRDDYSYSMRDVPEELIREIGTNAGVTRNGKGCLVLNTAEAMFVDIDISGPGFFAKLFGATREKEEKKYIAKLKEYLAQEPEAGARIYRTRGGLRYLFTHAPQPVDDAAIAILRQLGSDKLYVQLCRNQSCYRARLTPKPFRIGCGRINGHYPYATPALQDGFRRWLEMYTRNSDGFAVCTFLASEGNSRIHAAIAPVVTEHDTATRINTALPLA
ncbi:MAG: hypothetical protein PSY14_12400 [bacterium]|nr:hypothetical protein [bacterium]